MNSGSIFTRPTQAYVTSQACGLGSLLHFFFFFKSVQKSLLQTFWPPMKDQQVTRTFHGYTIRVLRGLKILPEVLMWSTQSPSLSLSDFVLDS